MASSRRSPGLEPVDPGDDDAVGRAPRRARRPGRSASLAAQRLELVLERLDLVEACAARRRRRRRCWCRRGGPTSASCRLVALQQLHGVRAGDGLDAAQVGADRALADDLDGADVAGGAARGCRRTARSSCPASSTRTMSPYLSPKNAIAPSAVGLVLGGLEARAPARWRRVSALAIASIAAISLGGDRRVVARSRSADGRGRRASRPASRARRAPCAAPSGAGGCRCGCGGWRRGARTSIAAVAVVARGRSSPLDDRGDVAAQAGQRERGVEHARPTPVVGDDRAGVADLAAALGVERGAVEEDLDGPRAVRRRSPGSTASTAARRSSSV